MADRSIEGTRCTRLSALVLSVSLASVLGSGCAQKRVHAEPEVPPLAAPTPPPRALPPLRGEPVEGALEPIEAPRTRPASRPRRPRATDTTARAETVRPEGPTDPQSLQPPPPENPPAEPAPALQLVPSGAEAARVETEIRQQMDRAARELNRVDYRALNTDARTQYDTAKRYLDLAEEAIRDRNLIFARTLADKAGSIAVVLLGRR